MLRNLASLGAMIVLVGCGAAAPFRPTAPSEVAAASPLGPSYVLVPRSSDDHALLGRVLPDAPDNGKPLDEVARPNECADKLGPEKTEPVVATFEDAQGLAADGKAKAALAPFGFEEDAPSATHFYYRLDIEKRITVAVTPEYLACCKDKGTCGYGIVTALGYGQGEFAAVLRDDTGASVEIPVAAEERGFIKAKVLHKRYVYGYVAALVTVTDPAKGPALTLLGDPKSAAAEPTEQDLPEPARAEFDQKKVQVVARAGVPAEFAYTFRDSRGDITENEFVRRYQDLTGAMDLSGARSNRNPFWLYYAVSATSVGAFLLGSAAYVSLATPTRTQIIGTNLPTPFTPASNCNVETLQNVTGTGWEIQCNPPLDPGLGKTMGIVGGAVFGTGIASFVVYGVLGYNGSPNEHVLTKSDAEAYAARYNRSLLHAAVRPPASQPPPAPHAPLTPQVQLTPIFTPGFAGLIGRF